MHILHMYCRFCGSTGMCLPLKRVGDIAFCFLGVDILLLSLMRGHIMSPGNLSFLSFYLSILFCILLIQIFHIFYNIVQFNIMLDFQIFSVLTWFMWFCQCFCWYAFMTINNLEYKIILNLYIFLGAGGGGGVSNLKIYFFKVKYVTSKHIGMYIMFPLRWPVGTYKYSHHRCQSVMTILILIIIFNYIK